MLLTSEEILSSDTLSKQFSASDLGMLYSQKIQIISETIKLSSHNKKDPIKSNSLFLIKNLENPP